METGLDVDTLDDDCLIDRGHCEGNECGVDRGQMLIIDLHNVIGSLLDELDLLVSIDHGVGDCLGLLGDEVDIEDLWYTGRAKSDGVCDWFAGCW